MRQGDAGKSIPPVQIEGGTPAPAPLATSAEAKRPSGAVGAKVTSPGRARAQERLKQLAANPKTSSADRGWIQQDMNSIKRGDRTTIRNPPGKQLAHTRGREAAKGYDHVKSPSKLQDTDLHKTQHKFDDFGRANKERP